MQEERTVLYEQPWNWKETKRFFLLLVAGVYYGSFFFAIFYLQVLEEDNYWFAILLLCIATAFVGFFWVKLAFDEPNIVVYKDVMRVGATQFETVSLRWILTYQEECLERRPLNLPIWVLRFVYYDHDGRERQVSLRLMMTPYEYREVLEDIKEVVPWAEVVFQPVDRLPRR